MVQALYGFKWALRPSSCTKKRIAYTFTLVHYKEQKKKKKNRNFKEKRRRWSHPTICLKVKINSKFMYLVENNLNLATFNIFHIITIWSLVQTHGAHMQIMYNIRVSLWTLRTLNHKTIKKGPYKFIRSHSSSKPFFFAKNKSLTFNILKTFDCITIKTIIAFRLIMF